MQELSWRMGVLPVCEHDVQVVAAPRQVWHVALQLRHVPRPSSVSRKLPIGQTDVHVPPAESCVTPDTHEVQLVEAPSVQVAHDGSQSVHVLLASANLPSGHDETQEASS